MDKEREELERMRKALEEIRDWSPLWSDRERFIFRLALWGLGEKERPAPEDFGLEKE